MAEAKIEIKVGAISFVGEGTEKWLSEELEKLLAKIPELVEIAPSESGSSNGAGTEAKSKKNGKLGSLSTFLRERNATDNQIKKFLATAVWLHDTTGRDRITTGEVAKALKNASQIRLTNASDALNQNVGKGYAEKDGDSGFFVTEPALDILPQFLLCLLGVKLRIAFNLLGKLPLEFFVAEGPNFPSPSSLKAFYDSLRPIIYFNLLLHPPVCTISQDRKDSWVTL
jgi:hypothetical protein